MRRREYGPIDFSLVLFQREKTADLGPGGDDAVRPDGFRPAPGAGFPRYLAEYEQTQSTYWPMYKNILVPVDLTDKNSAAVEEALRMARRGNATITLLHVIETLDLPFEEIEDFYKQLAAKARRKLRQLGKEASGRGPELRYETTYGRRARAILDHIVDHEIDLVVITSHRVEPDDPPSSWMTLSHQIALLASCSVMMLRLDD